MTNRSATTRYVIINADDFGYSPAVNAAVLRSHREGVLTSASLMVAQSAWQEAVEIARSEPSLGVGLHVAVSYDQSILPREEIPLLLDSSGRFGRDPFRVGLRYALSQSVKPQLLREIEAQFSRFASTGLVWSHADGHQHFHLHPAVWPLFADQCEAHGVTRYRLPNEELREQLKTEGDRSFANIAGLLAFRILGKRALRDLNARSARTGRRFFVCDRVYGTLQSGNMNARYVKGLVQRLQGVSNEIYFHPGAPHAQRLPSATDNNGIDDVEHSALLNLAFRQQLEAANCKTGTYTEVESMSMGSVGAVGDSVPEK